MSVMCRLTSLQGGTIVACVEGFSALRAPQIAYSIKEHPRRESATSVCPIGFCSHLAFRLHFGSILRWLQAIDCM